MSAAAHVGNKQVELTELREAAHMLERSQVYHQVNTYRQTSTFPLKERVMSAHNNHKQMLLCQKLNGDSTQTWVHFKPCLFDRV